LSAGSALASTLIRSRSEDTTRVISSAVIRWRPDPLAQPGLSDDALSLHLAHPSGHDGRVSTGLQRGVVRAALISARWVSAWGKFPCCFPVRLICSAYRPRRLRARVFANYRSHSAIRGIR
jgi:hypothetical protein